MKKDYDVVIVGAGVIGLAVAQSLTKIKNLSVLIIEKEENYGRGISSRNSEVIHSGIYYPPNSLKTKYCIKGRQLLYEFCNKHKIWYNKCGKIIIGQKSQYSEIERLYLRAKENGIDQIRIIKKNEIKNLEKYVKGEIALSVGCTGILSSHEFMSALYSISYNKGHDYLFKSEVVECGLLNNDGYKIKIINAYDDIESVTANWVVNSSGLYSDLISRMLFNDINVPKLVYMKGSYFKLSSKWNGKFNYLIYPLPDKTHGTLGIHLTFDRNGHIKLGPNAQLIKGRLEDYNVDNNDLDAFYYAAKKYIIGLKRDHLTPDHSGIRPKIRNNQFSDFYIVNETEKGFPGWINLIGIESPGLTSSLAIGDKVANIIKDEG